MNLELNLPDIPDAATKFRNAQPFPHLVIDGAVDDATLRAAVKCWPPADAPQWYHGQRRKHSFAAVADLAEPLQGVALALNGEAFTDWLSIVTGIVDLSADPSFEGAGLHEIERGGCLPMHCDFNRLGELYRRVNVLLYCNVRWDEDWRGSLELADDPSNPSIRKIIHPVFNRLVIAESSDRSWHGHPHVLRCPPGITRRSIAAYYYSAFPHESYQEDHSTRYVVDKDRIRREKLELKGRG